MRVGPSKNEPVQSSPVHPPSVLSKEGARSTRLPSAIAVAVVSVLQACVVTGTEARDAGGTEDTRDAASITDVRTMPDTPPVGDTPMSLDVAPSTDVSSNDVRDIAPSMDTTAARDVVVTDVAMPIDAPVADVVMPVDVPIVDVVSCTSGVACTPSNPCHTGTTDCTTGSSICRDTGANVADGTACGGGRTCTAGTCACNDNPCRLMCGASVVNACGETVSCGCPATRPHCCGDVCVCSTCVCP